MTEIISKYEIAKAYGRKKHEGQSRKYTGLPYHTHTERVADRVAMLFEDMDMIIAALLHDVVEDTDATFSEIYTMFGPRVHDLVKELTDVYTKEAYPQFNRAQRKMMETARLTQISVKAKQIKLCDLADNTADVIENDPGFAKIYLIEKAAILEAFGF